MTFPGRITKSPDLVPDATLGHTEGTFPPTLSRKVAVLSVLRGAGPGQ